MENKTKVQQSFENILNDMGFLEGYTLGDDLIVIANDHDFVGDVYDYSTLNRADKKISPLNHLIRSCNGDNIVAKYFDIDKKTKVLKVPKYFDHALVVEYHTRDCEFSQEEDSSTLRKIALFTSKVALFEEYTKYVSNFYADICGTLEINGINCLNETNYPSCEIEAVVGNNKFICFDSKKYFAPYANPNSNSNFDYTSANSDKIFSQIWGEIVSHRENTTEME